MLYFQSLAAQICFLKTCPLEAVAPEPGVWTFNAVCYCSFQILTASIDFASEFKNALVHYAHKSDSMPEMKSHSLRSINHLVHKGLEHAFKLLDGGHLEEARMSLNLADEAPSRRALNRIDQPAPGRSPFQASATARSPRAGASCARPQIAHPIFAESKQAFLSIDTCK